jgi:peptide/nickel transport system substrate-binding protein
MKKGFSKVPWVVLVLLIITSLVLISYSGDAATAVPKTTTPATSKPTAPSPVAQQPQFGGTMKITTQRGPNNFGYPPEIASINAEAVTACIEALFGYDGNLTNFKGVLATDYKIADDLLSVTITLHKGVKFHDGTDFNAQAAKWNMDLNKAAKITGTETWKSIDVINDYTIRINFTQFDNSLLTNWRCQDGFAHRRGEEWTGVGPSAPGEYGTLQVLQF